MLRIWKLGIFNIGHWNSNATEQFNYWLDLGSLGYFELLIAVQKRSNHRILNFSMPRWRVKWSNILERDRSKQGVTWLLTQRANFPKIATSNNSNLIQLVRGFPRRREENVRNRNLRIKNEEGSKKHGQLERDFKDFLTRAGANGW